jgi:sulfatase modifying factor 1
MQVIKFVRNTVLLVSLVSVAASCNPFKAKKEKSTATGWNYNDQQYGNFNVVKPKDIKTAPGLVFVQGGTFTMGAVQEDIMADWNNIPHRVTVNSFFIDKYEVSNLNYREYLYWLEGTFGAAGMDSIVTQALPDTLVWREELAYNEPMVEYYFRHPSYNNYPVVGCNLVTSH